MAINRWRTGAILVVTVTFALTVTSPAAAFVWWQGSGGIGTAQLDGTNVQTACAGNSAGGFGAKDASHLYYASSTDTGDSTIARANLDCSQANNSLVLTGSQFTVEAIAVDGAHIYWSDANGIGRANIDGSSPTPGFVPEAAIGGAPSSLAVDGGHIYWTGLGQSIGRANIDGSSPTSSWMPTAAFPGSLATDGSHVYWSEAGAIGRVNVEGSDRREPFVSSAPIDRFSAVTTDSHYLYWTQASQSDGTGGSIGRANLDGSAPNPRFIVPSIGVGGGVMAVDSASASASATALSCPPTAAEGFSVDLGEWVFAVPPRCTVTVSDLGGAPHPPTGALLVTYPGEIVPAEELLCQLRPSSASTSTCMIAEPLAGNYQFEAFFGTHTVQTSYSGDTFHFPSTATPATTKVVKAGGGGGSGNHNSSTGGSRPAASLGTIHVKGGSVTVPVQCSARSRTRCTLTITISTKTGRTRVVLGSAHLTLKAGAHRNLRIRLKLGRLRHRKHPLRGLLVLSEKSSSGRLVTIAQRTLKLS
jgi:hypothetical protein